MRFFTAIKIATYILLVFLLGKGNSWAQQIDTTGCSLLEPLAIRCPDWDSIVVDSATGGVRLVWRQVHSEGHAGYCICSGSPCLTIDTLWSPSDTVYVVATHSAMETHRYSIFSIDSCLHAGEMTTAAGNMLLRADIDSCAHKVSLHWQLEELPEEDATGAAYRLWVDGTVAATLSTGTTTYTVQVPSDRFQVRVQLQAVTPAIRVWSNSMEILFPSPDDCPPDDTAHHPLPPVLKPPVMPNCFTPQLSTNNCFAPVFPTASIPEGYVMRIFNRMGVLVFESHDPSACWDGRHRGTLLPQGVYVYHIVYSVADQSSQVSGTVTLLR